MDWEGGRSVQDMERALFSSLEPGGQRGGRLQAPCSYAGPREGYAAGSQDNLQDSVQNENKGPLLQKLRISGCNSGALNQAWSPSQCTLLCTCTGHMPTKLALYSAQAPIVFVWFFFWFFFFFFFFKQACGCRAVVRPKEF